MILALKRPRAANPRRPQFFGRVHLRWLAELTIHDPLAAATIFYRSLCDYENERMAVELPLGTREARPRGHKMNRALAIELLASTRGGSSSTSGRCSRRRPRSGEPGSAMRRSCRGGKVGKEEVAKQPWGRRSDAGPSKCAVNVPAARMMHGDARRPLPNS